MWLGEGEREGVVEREGCLCEVMGVYLWYHGCGCPLQDKEE